METTTSSPLATVVKGYEKQIRSPFTTTPSFYEHVKINRKRYGQLLRGEKRLNEDEIKALARFFGVTVNDFFQND